MDHFLKNYFWNVFKSIRTPVQPDECLTRTCDESGEPARVIGVRLRHQSSVQLPPDIVCSLPFYSLQQRMRTVSA